MSDRAFRLRLAHERRAPRRPRTGRIGQDNGKAGYAVAFPVTTCARATPFCRAACYACTGPAMFRDSVRKNVAVQVSCESDPRAFATKVESEFRHAAARGLRVKGGADNARFAVRIPVHFVRWNGSGDLFPAARRAILALARRGVWVHVFTRDPREGAALRRVAQREGLPVLILLSVDATSEADCFRWRGPFAALTSAAAPAPWARLDPARTVAFPADARADAIATVPPAFRGGACPCDMGARSYVGSCARCFEEGTGCFMHVGE